MQREIKFRGKRRDNGEWVTGSLVSTSPEEAFILIGITGHIKRDDYECYMAEVIPESVGQFTGLKDKNGVDVYEGDLYTPNHGDKVYPVMFISGAFVGGSSPAHCQPLGWEDDCIDIDLWFSIVGNIHDNPESLNPSQKGDVNYNMNNNFDPKEGQPEEVKADLQPASEQATDGQQATQESAEEGGEG